MKTVEAEWIGFCNGVNKSKEALVGPVALSFFGDPTTPMRIVRVFLTTSCLFALIIGLMVVQHSFLIWLATSQWEVISRPIFLHRLQYMGVLAIGWGVGVTGWLLTGHQALTCFFVNVPRASTLWQKQVLTSILPVFKYLIAGGLFVGLGSILAQQLWGLWAEAYDVGLLAGAVVGLVHTLMESPNVKNYIDFLEANQRYVNSERTSLFTEYKKP